MNKEMQNTVRKLIDKGLSAPAIALKVGMSRKYVTKYTEICLGNEYSKKLLANGKQAMADSRKYQRLWARMYGI